jgi:hypothetical protein
MKQETRVMSIHYMQTQVAIQKWPYVQKRISVPERKKRRQKLRNGTEYHVNSGFPKAQKSSKLISKTY